MAYKTFADGDVLTAADVNNYLMRQSVIVCTSGTRPTSPAEGMVIYETDTDTYQGYTGAVWAVIGRLGVAPNIQTFSANGTWTKPTGARLVHIRAVGGGGGGGGATGAGAGIAEGGGGGGGGYCESLYLASALGATEAVTIGTSGAGGTNGTTDGSAGGNTTFGSGPYFTASGGAGGTAGGTASTGTVAAAGGAGGGATGGTVISIAGGSGSVGRVLGGLGVMLGRGGSSQMAPESASPTSISANGPAGAPAGGGGAGALAATVTRAGGAGAAGLLIAITYF